MKHDTGPMGRLSPEEVTWEYIDDLEDKVTFQGGEDVTISADTTNQESAQETTDDIVLQPSSQNHKNKPPTKGANHQSG